ncbi:MAG: DEAD/DEAH box helicase, partial [Polyangiaceae bacterium]|nr:DEAD/DEAH box helicase [Polyangiaceae bacterium]
MSGKNMDVFSLRDSIVSEYSKFATSFTTIHAADIRAQIEAIYSKARFWPDPLLQINPNYKRGLSLETLIANGALHARIADIFRDDDGAPLSLYKHQAQAVDLAWQGKSFVVTTGTGSGKSLCFFIPIVSALLTEKSESAARRTRAIVIYPMNALANSQFEELGKFVKNVQSERPVTFARYTGQEDSEERRRIAENPPDILLTNFMMLELLMTRQDELDRKVIGNCQGLRFLVLDELHTYRGRQGADVALLVRRVRERLSHERLQCIGTSATMASEGTAWNKQEVVAKSQRTASGSSWPATSMMPRQRSRTTMSRRAKRASRLTAKSSVSSHCTLVTTNSTLPTATWTTRRPGSTSTPRATRASRATTAAPARAKSPSHRTARRAPARGRGSSPAAFASAFAAARRTAPRPVTARASRLSRRKVEARRPR